MHKTILAIDDDPNLLTVMRLGLVASGYAVVTASSGTQGMQLLREHQPDLVLLDVMMPEMDGWETCERIRAMSPVPIIFLTARQAERDRIKGLGLGADDYISKPFRLTELRARLDATLQRRYVLPSPRPILCYGGGELIINTVKRAVIVRGKEVGMTLTEYRLLLHLAERSGYVLTTKQIGIAIWDTETGTVGAGVNWYVWRLRGKIERDPARPRFILTEPGIGYRFVASENPVEKG